MNIEKVHIAFKQVIGTPGIYHKLNIPKNNVAQYRWKLKRNVHITIDKKLWVLQRAGYRLESFQYTDKDVVEAIRFAINASQATKKMGAEYILEKWKSATGK
ncbi:hypothetical protein FAM09_24840 [Niastella caeni]|uniref:Uncharacterized protein n=1 Tax=Niastella caeni TaxID=2569763 RepID=A0A4S8HJ04_9BACT|nr:hypothetical protein [Niastella caeni]THU34249.1 hypothetical protein FAM09_24840 [Niastella caeni]